MDEEGKNAVYERLQKQQEVLIQKQQDKLEKALQPKRSFDDLVEKGVLLLPELIDWEKVDYPTQGLIDVHKMRRSFDRVGIKLAHNKAYNIRKELIKRLTANEGALLKKLKKSKSNGQ